MWLQPLGDRSMLSIGTLDQKDEDSYVSLQKEIQEGNENLGETLESGNRVFFQVGQSKYNLGAYSLMPQSLLEENQRALTKNLIMIAGIMLIVAAAAAYLVSKSLTRPLEKMTQTVKKIRDGDTRLRIQRMKDDEIGELAQNFNEMLDQIESLISREYETKLLLNRAEYKALQAQINPHFLYNTLDSINWMAIDKGEYEISKMLRDLGVILRYSVSRSNQIVRVSEAADWLEKYVSLQQLRFNYAFSFALHVEEQVKSVGIYKLLLQPFIENSILHGFKEITGGGILRVDIVLSENQKMLHVIIEDNGKGMEPEEVKRYNDRERILGGAGSGIGLTNAFCRMHMYYGEKAEWNVSSIQNVGTVITIKLPVSDAGDRSVPELQEENAGIG